MGWDSSRARSFRQIVEPGCVSDRSGWWDDRRRLSRDPEASPRANRRLRDSTRNGTPRGSSNYCGRLSTTISDTPTWVRPGRWQTPMPPCVGCSNRSLISDRLGISSTVATWRRSSSRATESPILEAGGQLRGLDVPSSESENRQVVERLIAATDRRLDASHPVSQARHPRWVGPADSGHTASVRPSIRHHPPLRAPEGDARLAGRTRIVDPWCCGFPQPGDARVDFCDRRVARPAPARPRSSLL